MMSAMIHEFFVRVESVLLVLLVTVQVVEVSRHFGKNEALILALAYGAIIVGSWWAAWRTCKRHRAEREQLAEERRKVLGVD